MRLIQHEGSVDDIRCHLKFMNPSDSYSVREHLEYLNNSLDFEVKNKNRVTVINMLRAKINQIKRLRTPRVASSLRSSQ